MFQCWNLYFRMVFSSPISQLVVTGSGSKPPGWLPSFSCWSVTMPLKHRCWGWCSMQNRYMYQGIIMCHYWEQNDWNSDWNETLYFQHFCENSSGNVWITAQFQSAADISTLPHPSILTCAMGQKLPEKRSWSLWIFGQGQFWNVLNP